MHVPPCVTSRTVPFLPLNSLAARRLLILGVALTIGLLFLSRLFFMQVLDDSYAVFARNNAIKEVRVYAPRGQMFDRKNRLLVANTELNDLLVTPARTRLAPHDTLALCGLLGISVPDFRERMADCRAQGALRPSPFITQIPDSVYARTQERMWEFTGFEWQKRVVRNYPTALAGHVLGYIGEVTDKQIEADPYYTQGDYRGVGGLEQSYEPYLRGTRGVRYEVHDVHNKPVGKWQSGKFDVIPVSGKNLELSIDSKLQAFAERLMQGKRGSVVAIDPRTGEVLAYVSAPTYDPNQLVGPSRGNNYMALLHDADKPLFNRPIQAKYPPGSIFKLAESAIGQQDGGLSPGTRYICGGGFNVGAVRVKCAHGENHGVPDLFTAIERSCNSYFCQVFRTMMNPPYHNSNRQALQLWHDRMFTFGLGHKTEIDLPHELNGLVPSPAYYDKRYKNDRWRWSNFVSLAIGQGELGVTPLQMANYACVFANRGYYFTPHLVRAIGTERRVPTRFLEKHLASPNAQAFNVICDAMLAVVEHGTARSAYTTAVQIAGKTGTAQNPHGEDHSVFVSFAPFDNPQIAISVYVENGGAGAAYAAPIASVLSEYYLTDTLTAPRRSVADWIEQKVLK